jgi:hypothetical protein
MPEDGDPFVTIESIDENQNSSSEGSTPRYCESMKPTLPRVLVKMRFLEVGLSRFARNFTSEQTFRMRLLSVIIAVGS